MGNRWNCYKHVCGNSDLLYMNLLISKLSFLNLCEFLTLLPIQMACDDVRSENRTASSVCRFCFQREPWGTGHRPGTGSPVGPSLSSRTGTPQHGRTSPRTHPDSNTTKFIITSYTIHVHFFLKQVQIFNPHSYTRLTQN